MKDNKIFSVGETVVSLYNTIATHSQNLKKGHLYSVCAVSYCPNCGAQAINVGEKIPPLMDAIIECDCGHEHDHNGLQWSYSYRFARPSELQKEMESAVEVEDYELATELRDILNASK